MRYWVCLKCATLRVIHRSEAKNSQIVYTVYIYMIGDISKKLNSDNPKQSWITATLMGQDGPNTVKKKSKINLSSMDAAVNKPIYLLCQGLHINTREPCSNSNWLFFFKIHSWLAFDRAWPKVDFFFLFNCIYLFIFCWGLIISM